MPFWPKRTGRFRVESVKAAIRSARRRPTAHDQSVARIEAATNMSAVRWTPSRPKNCSALRSGSFLMGAFREGERIFYIDAELSNGAFDPRRSAIKGPQDRRAQRNVSAARVCHFPPRARPTSIRRWRQRVLTGVSGTGVSGPRPSNHEIILSSTRRPMASRV